MNDQSSALLERKAPSVIARPGTAGDTPLNRAKASVGIADLWLKLGLSGKPPHAGGKCKSPLRQDGHPSFSITPDGKHFKDWSYPEHSGGLIDFVMLATNCDKVAACAKLIEIAGTGPHIRSASRSTPVRPLRLPSLTVPSYSEVLRIQELRRLPMTVGLEIAIKRGLLWCAEVFDAGSTHRAWIVTDRAKKNAQARKLDGSAWEGIKAKAKTIPGACANWPVGAANLGSARNVILTEGPPDMFAAMTFAWFVNGGEIDHIGFACVTGAANTLHEESLPMFDGKHVRIAYDNDDAGRAAAKRWAGQLHAAGASVDGFSVDGLSKADGTSAKDVDDVSHYMKEPLSPAALPQELQDFVTFQGSEVVS